MVFRGHTYHCVIKAFLLAGANVSIKERSETTSRTRTCICAVASENHIPLKLQRNSLEQQPRFRISIWWV